MRGLDQADTRQSCSPQRPRRWKTLPRLIKRTFLNGPDGRLVPIPNWISVLLVISLAGCTSATIQRAQDISTAGKAYAQASENLMDAAMNAAIDADSFTKVATKVRGGTQPPTEQADQLAKELEESNAGLVVTLARYQQLRTSFVTLGAYFVALQELAANPQSHATASAVASLADRAREINAVLAKDGKLVLPSAEINSLNGLSKLVADQVHGVVVAAALRRDASTIGRTLAISKKAVQLAETDVRDYLTLKQDAFYRDYVQKPYVVQSIGDQWVEDRREYLKAAALGKASDAISKAEAASKQMQKTWEKMLSGDFSTAELHKMLGEINQLLGAVNTLKSSTRAEKPTATP